MGLDTGRMRCRAVAALVGLGLHSAALHAAPVDYQLTPTHSFVHFEWPHAGLSTSIGRFDRVAGTVTLDREAGRGHGQVSVQPASVNTGRPALDQALRSALAADTPLQVLLSLVLGEDGSPARVQAVLQARGDQAALTLELQRTHYHCYTSPLLRREVCGGEFSTTLDPAALGVHLPPAFGLQGPVLLRLQVEAVRQEPAS